VAVCEATANLWLKTYQAFEKYNIGVKLANPLKTKAIAEAKIKTDTTDARLCRAYKGEEGVSTQEIKKELIRAIEIMQSELEVNDRLTDVLSNARLALIDKSNNNSLLELLPTVFHEPALIVVIHISYSKTEDRIFQRKC
jgi:transposase